MEETRWNSAESGKIFRYVTTCGGRGILCRLHYRPHSLSYCLCSFFSILAQNVARFWSNFATVRYHNATKLLSIMWQMPVC